MHGKREIEIVVNKRWQSLAKRKSAVKRLHRASLAEGPKIEEGDLLGNKCEGGSAQRAPCGPESIGKEGPTKGRKPYHC